jgi:hypothetical protein
MKPDKAIFHFTVAQLIEELQRLPADLPVLTSGYESGFENIYHPEIVTLKYEPESPYFEGQFQTADDLSPDSFQAAILMREHRDD